jgi:rhodanese-related sulfurtransferase
MPANKKINQLQQKSQSQPRWVLAVLFALVVGAFGGHYLFPAEAASPAGYAYGCNPHALPVLREGATGGCVELAQAYLRDHGYTNVAIDGDFGIITYNAVRSFQKSQHISIDGAIGPVTWSRLMVI